jgi:hypothetical protein
MECSVILLHNFHIFRNRLTDSEYFDYSDKLHINIRTICLITRNIFYSIVLSVLNYLELSHLHAYLLQMRLYLRLQKTLRFGWFTMLKWKTAHNQQLDW